MKLGTIPTRYIPTLITSGPNHLCMPRGWVLWRVFVLLEGNMLPYPFANLFVPFKSQERLKLVSRAPGELISIWRRYPIFSQIVCNQCISILNSTGVSLFGTASTAFGAKFVEWKLACRGVGADFLG